MLPLHVTTLRDQLSGLAQYLRQLVTPAQLVNNPVAIEARQLPTFVRICPVAQKYLALLGDLDWEYLPQ